MDVFSADLTLPQLGICVIIGFVGVVSLLYGVVWIIFQIYDAFCQHIACRVIDCLDDKELRAYIERVMYIISEEQKAGVKDGQQSNKS